MPNMSGNCRAIFEEENIQADQRMAREAVPSGRSMSVGIERVSACGKLVYSWMLAILLR